MARVGGKSKLEAARAWTEGPHAEWLSLFPTTGEGRRPVPVWRAVGPVAGRGSGCFTAAMAKLVLLHKADSIYDDEPDRLYDFPRAYLKAVGEGMGDWVIYYEPVKAGPRGYFAVAKIARVIPKPGAEGRYLALIEPGSYLEFDRHVPRLVQGRPWETALRDADGHAKAGGAQQLAVRRLPDAEFAAIVRAGLPDDLERVEATRYNAQAGVEEPLAPFERPVTERLVSRPYRDVAFRRKVRAAYDYRCAMSGLRLRNGGGRPEVNAAHIIPVERQGSDAVTNGLALSGTLHWMFDRGLVSVAEDWTILVSRNKVPGEVVDRLIVPDGRLVLPDDRRDWPNRTSLRWHRENVFGQMGPEGPQPWA
jgi:putative restriction endonuclease